MSMRVSIWIFSIALFSSQVAMAQFSAAFMKTPPQISIAQSGNFNGSNGYLYINPPASSSTKYTFASWIRPTSFGTMLLNAGADVSHISHIHIWSSCSCLTVSHQNGSIYRHKSGYVPTLSQWIHLVVSVDTTQAVANDRVRIWINAIPQTMTSDTDGFIPQGTSLYLGRNIRHAIGSKFDGDFPFAGQMAETYYLNGINLGPEAFVRPFGSTLRSITYTGPQTSSVYLKYPTGALGTNAFTGGLGNLTNSNVSVSALIPY